MSHFSDLSDVGPAATAGSVEPLVADATMRLWKREGAALAMPAVKTASTVMAMNFFMLCCCIASCWRLGMNPGSPKFIMDTIFGPTIKANRFFYRPL